MELRLPAQARSAAIFCAGLGYEQAPHMNQLLITRAQRSGARAGMVRLNVLTHLIGPHRQAGQHCHHAFEAPFQRIALSITSSVHLFDYEQEQRPLTAD